MKSVFRHVGAYFWYLRANWLSLMAYPVPFVVVNLAGLLYSLVSAAAVWIIFSKVRAIGGWSFPQVLLIYGFKMCIRDRYQVM